MDVTAITQIITSIGFPCAMCVWMGQYVKQLNADHREDVQKLNETYSTEVAKMTDALNNNTLALQKLSDRIGGGINE